MSLAVLQAEPAVQAMPVSLRKTAEPFRHVTLAVIVPAPDGVHSQLRESLVAAAVGVMDGF